MSEAAFIQWAILAGFGIAGFLMKRTLDRIENEQENLKEDNQRIKAQYLHKDDFKEFKQELRGMFEEIKQNIRSLQKHE
jgi:phosphatidylinositol kinase/protein kinase (PI-3  family)